MICFKCNGEEFATQSAVIRQDFRDEQLDVTTPVAVCTTCGWQTLAPGQTDELRKRTADAYRQKHGLLISAEIVAYRTKLKMSQQEFADFLKVGVASVKRWETWQVQDQSSDELIRVKCEFHPACQQPFTQFHFAAYYVSLQSHLEQGLWNSWNRPKVNNVRLDKRFNSVEEPYDTESVPDGDLALAA